MMVRTGGTSTCLVPRRVCTYMYLTALIRSSLAAARENGSSADSTRDKKRLALPAELGRSDGRRRPLSDLSKGKTDE